MSKVKEVYIKLANKATPHQHRLMTFGIFEGAKVRIIKEDKINKLLILGIGKKRIAVRKEEVTDIQFIEAHV